jgi:internalin A
MRIAELPFTLKESGVIAFPWPHRTTFRPSLCGTLLVVLFVCATGARAADQIIETAAGTVTVKVLPGKTTEEALVAALHEIRTANQPSTHDDPQSVFALKRIGATLLTDVRGNVSSISFSKSGTQSNDLAAAAKFTDKTTPYLTGLIGLRTLNLSGAKITNESLEIIGKLTMLSSLHLASTGIDDDGLAFLAPLVELRYLDIGTCNISGPGLKHLANFDELLSINLTSDPVPNEHLADIVEMESLRRVYLTGTLVTDEGVATLNQLEHLKVISLYATRVSNAALPTLAKMPQLETLYLEKSLVTPEGINWLKKERPKLQIYGP